jgi:cytochrome c-type biogenesis protein CcmH
MRLSGFGLTLALALSLPLSALADDGHGTTQRSDASHLFEYVEGAQRLEGQILAPCCWNQTLDIHGSEVSNQLRREIRTRLRAGESTEVIQGDLVRRYGAKILAVPPSSPLRKFALGLSVAFGAAGVGAAFMLFRWRRRGRTAAAAQPAPPAETADERRHLDDRLQAELDRLEG